MTVEVELHGERRAVELRRDGDRWRVRLGGREVVASLVEVGGRWSLLVEPPPGAPDATMRAARSYEVAIEPAGGSDRRVHVGGVAVALSIVDPRAFRRRARSGGERGAAGAAAIVAPMAGRIVKVLVARGDAVTARQGVVVIEAMKMENELRAPRAGVIAEVRVTQGMSVDAQSVLVVLE